MGMETIFVCFVIYYIIEEIMEIKKVKLEYFQSAWNVMDCVVILISLFNIFIAIFTEFVVSDLLKVKSFEKKTFIYNNLKFTEEINVYIFSAYSCWAPDFQWFWYTELLDWSFNQYFR